MAKINRALLSVYDKTGIVTLAKALRARRVEILSTGKTAALLRKARIPVQEVSDYTGTPELLEGRVKTLHPKLHAAILADRSKKSHRRDLKRLGIEPIDLVIVNLYPFEQVIQRKGVRLEEALEFIDIGGSALIRASAKNFPSVCTVTSPQQYPLFLKEFKRHGTVSLETRKRLAQEAFWKSASYEAAIQEFLGRNLNAGEKSPSEITLSLSKVRNLRYGENPHQPGALYRVRSGEWGVRSIGEELLLEGKELSFNNLLDLNAAFRLLQSFEASTACVIKHTNPCGVASAASLKEAYLLALNCDPESAFGGIVGVNRRMDAGTARQIVSSQFAECVAAPAFEPAALRFLRKKKNLRAVLFPKKESGFPRWDLRRIEGGFLAQSPDEAIFSKKGLRVVTKRKPTPAQLGSLFFAFKVAKHLQSNAIVIAQGERSVGLGAGQMSRVEAVRLAIRKAGERAFGGCLASDGFFPMVDNVEEAARAGILAIIQPGGSIRDKEVITTANRLGLAMVFTGIRHFRH